MNAKHPVLNSLPNIRDLKQNDALFRSAIENMPLGVSMFDREDRLILFNDRYREMHSLPAEVMQPGTPFSEIIANTPGHEIKDRGPSETGTERQLRYGPDDKVVVREWLLDDGRHIEITIARIAGGACIALHEDVTQQRKALESIVYMARHDPLTGLLNRARFLSLLDEALDTARLRTPLALLEIDLDGFKSVNDTMGHAAGDELLINVANRLKFSVPDGVNIARLGGDEFALFTTLNKPTSSAEELGSMIIAQLKEPFRVNETPVYIGASVGIAIAPNHGKTTDKLLHSADTALYRAKHEGRLCVRQFSQDMNSTFDKERNVRRLA